MRFISKDPEGFGNIRDIVYQFQHFFGLFVIFDTLLLFSFDCILQSQLYSTSGSKTFL